MFLVVLNTEACLNSIFLPRDLYCCGEYQQYGPRCLDSALFAEQHFSTEPLTDKY